MNRDSFPVPPEPIEEQSAQTIQPDYSAEAELPSEVVERWFREAREHGCDFVYRCNRPPQSTRRIMVVAEGVDSASILRVLLDEQEIIDS